MKRKLKDYDDANALSMAITDALLDSYDPYQDQDKIEITLDRSGYSFDLQDIIKEVILNRFNINEK